jgi:hypothetical protein
MIRPMATAPKNKAIVIVTQSGAHKARWDPDPRFLNFWSATAERALTKTEAVGWMHRSEWRGFVGKANGK